MLRALRVYLRQSYVEIRRRLLFVLFFGLCLTGQMAHAQPEEPDTSRNWESAWRAYPFYQDTLVEELLLMRLDSLSELYEMPWVRSEDNYGTPVVRNFVANNWRFGLIFILLLVIGFARLLFPGILIRFLRAFTAPKALDDLLEDQQSEMSSFALVLSFFFSLLYAFPLQLWFWQLGFMMTDYAWGDYIVLAMLIFAYFMSRYFLEVAIGRIFEARYFTATLFYYTVVLNFILAAILLLIFLYVLLNGWPIEAVNVVNWMIGALVLTLLIKLIRTFLHAASSYTYPRFYLILYLCALEIMPWFVAIKLVEMNLN
ncbi:MAG: DUF4271 domain-containing protein [Bacteroidetes bacterium]|nr:MAG: DUF4271 domain-containing protein [Bacteroidota bacterium]